MSQTVNTTVDRPVHSRSFRLLALGGVLVLLGASVVTLQTVTSAVGGTQTLLTITVGMLAASTLLARTIRPAVAAVLATLAGAVGFGYYLSVTGVDLTTLLETGNQLLGDVLALTTGLPILGMLEAGVWALAFVPAPVFLSWYLALRGRYVLSVIPGGAALLFLTLTGDATAPVVFAGTLGSLAAIGCGELEARGATVAHADVLAIVFAVALVTSMSMALVPLDTGDGTGPDVFGSAGEESLEGNLVGSPDRSTIQGSVDLSTEVRFTVQSESESLWRTGTYDRFTGDEWVRTGDEAAYEPLSGPPGQSRPQTQTVTAETRMEAMPAAPEPVDVDGETRQNTQVTTHGQYLPEEPLTPGDSYTVESQQLVENPGLFRTAGTEYPDHIEERYLQTPEETSEEFETYTSELTAEADNPYDKAAIIEAYLQDSKEYSLSVDRPDGNVAEDFLFEMDAGYCVYFGTTMVQMLRSEEIPARYAVGYTSGQQVDHDEWVVRGMNAHAWVEVYLPDHGWVTFDPTPADPRDDDRADRLEDARADGDPEADTGTSADFGIDRPAETDEETDDEETASEEDTDDSGPEGTDPLEDDQTEEAVNESAEERNESTDAGSNGEAESVTPAPPSAETTAFGLVLLMGLVAGIHRTGAVSRLRGQQRRYWQQPQDTPNADIKEAYRRVESHLGKRYRSRRPGETPRQYLEAINASSNSEAGGLDHRTWTLLEIYERAVYGEAVSESAAQRAVAIADSVTRQRLPVVGRWWAEAESEP